MSYLEWQQDPPKDRMTWQEAIAYAESIGDGWRLPTIQELISQLDFTKFSPATSKPGWGLHWYWSSTTYGGYPDGAWLVGFGGGYVSHDDKGNSYYVRCVREPS